MSESRRVRHDLPFRRIALVLSGGGALGAYEVGVLRALEAAGLRPSILAGVSVGAINAVLWLAHGFRTAALEQVWRTLRASTIGMRWITLAVRAVGAALMTVAALQMVLTLMGSHELSPRRMFARAAAADSGIAAALLDVLAWALVGLTGALILMASRTAEDTLARLSPARDPQRLQRLFGIVLAGGAFLHAVTWVAGWPWPHRFSASVLLLGTIAWIVNRSGPTGDRLRRVLLRVIPETGGRGLWGSDARRRLIRQIVAAGDPPALVSTRIHLIISACAIETGRMCYFVNWPDPPAAFRDRIARAVGRVVPLTTPDDIIEAAVASSAVPAVFEPVRLGGETLVDGGIFNNQPLHAVLADEADAMVVVLVSPSSGPPQPSHEPHLLELGGRLMEVANWRNLQSELGELPQGWRREPSASPQSGTAPARACVIEPDGPLPGGQFGYSTTHAAELMRRGAEDAWRALDAAGWLADAPAAPAGEAPRPSAGTGVTPA